MSTPRNAISEITKDKDRWTIVAKVIRLWTVPSMDRSSLPSSMDMVLMDSRGDRIHATAKRTVIYKFENFLKEGNVYCFHYFEVVDNTGNFKTTHHPFKILFYLDTKINPVNMNAMPKSPFSLVPIPDILAEGFDITYLVDVMGIMTGYGSEKLVDVRGNMTKKNYIVITDSNGCEVSCVLFGNYVDHLNSYLASGETGNPVVVVQFASVKDWQNKKNLQNAMYCTQILFNPDFPEVSEFKKRAVESNDTLSQGVSQISDVVRMTKEEDLLLNCVPKTIEELKSSKEGLPCAVLASITHIVDPDSWWYQACKCSKSVYADSKMFFCDKCNKHVINVSPRYRIRLGVVDHTGATNFVLFDRDASDILGKTCRQMIENQENNNDNKSCPSEISALVDSTFLFKVDSNGGSSSSKFEHSFKVKGLSSDSETIKKFGGDGIEKVYLSDCSVENRKTLDTQKTVDLTDDSPASVTATKISNVVSLSVAANLDNDFQSIQDTVNDNEDNLGLSSQIEVIGNVVSESQIDVEIAPAKRTSPEPLDESLEASSNGKPMKIIKQEKNA